MDESPRRRIADKLEGFARNALIRRRRAAMASREARAGTCTFAQ